MRVSGPPQRRTTHLDPREGEFQRLAHRVDHEHSSFEPARDLIELQERDRTWCRDRRKITKRNRQ